MKNVIVISCFLTIFALCGNGLLFGSNNNMEGEFYKNNYKNAKCALLSVKNYVKKASAAQEGAFEGYEEILLKDLPEGHSVEYFLECMVLKCKIVYVWIMLLLAQERYELAADNREKLHERANVSREKLQLSMLKAEIRRDFSAIENYEWSFTTEKNEIMENLMDLFQEKLRQRKLEELRRVGLFLRNGHIENR